MSKNNKAHMIRTKIVKNATRALSSPILDRDYEKLNELQDVYKVSKPDLIHILINTADRKAIDNYHQDKFGLIELRNLEREISELEGRKALLLQKRKKLGGIASV